MKILITTIFKYPQMGGVSTYISNLKESMEENGHSVNILSISDTKKYFSKVDWEKCDKFQKKIYEEFTGITPEVAIKWEVFRFIFEMLVQKISETYDIVHANDVFSIDILKRKFENTPVLITPHACLIEECILENMCGENDNLLNYAKLHNDSVELADGFIGISQYIIKKFNKNLDQNNVHLVHTGLVKKTKNENNLNKNHGKVEICFLGRLVPIKGIETLIKSLKIVEDRGNIFNCRIVGEGYLEEQLKKLVKKNALKSIEFVGGSDMAEEYLIKSDIFVLPSKSENFPLALIEAMLNNNAIIASNVGGIPEIITDNLNGMLFNPYSIEELSNKIELLINNEHLREKFSKKSLEISNTKFSQKNMFKNMLEVYKLYVEEETNAPDLFVYDS